VRVDQFSFIADRRFRGQLASKRLHEGSLRGAVRVPKPIVQLRQQRRQGCSHGRSALKCRSLSWRDNCSERPRVLPARRGSVRRAETERDVRAVTGGQEVPGSSPGSPTTCQFRDLGGTIHGASFFVGTAFVYEFSTNDLDRGQGPTAHVLVELGGRHTWLRRSSDHRSSDAP
jgi:hypothetical protein